MSHIMGRYEDNETHQHYILQPNYVTKNVNHTEERIIESVSYIFEGRNYNISGGEFQ
jgi:hypothetical protein